MASNPTKLPINPLGSTYHNFPASAFRLSDEHDADYRKKTDVRQAFQMLSGHFLMKNPVPIPREVTSDRHYGMGNRDRNASAQSKPIVVGVRTVYGQTNMGKAYELLPEGGFPAFSKEQAKANIESKVYASGGIECSYNRILKYMRPRDARVTLSVPTHEEVSMALDACGFGREVLANAKPRSLDFEAENVVRVNAHSSNGFPVRGTLADDEALMQVMRLTQMIQTELRQKRIDPVNGRAILFDTVEQWYNITMETRPWLVIAEGKVKSDYYSLEKVQQGMLRFYNVIPRQAMLIMQQATQSAEDVALNCLSPRTSSSFIHTAKGITFTGGGADSMISVMDIELRTEGMAWEHAGDDTFAAISDGRTTALFSIDATSFDLTQHAEVMLPIIDEMTDRMRHINADAAELWGVYQKRRIVAMGKGLVVEMTHGGPSGSPLQSVKNDVLMEIVMMRLKSKVMSQSPYEKGIEPPTATRLDEMIQEVGKELDLQLRLEDYAVSYRSAASRRAADGFHGIREVLADRPFLFLGYYLYGHPWINYKIYPYIDIKRSLAQRSFKGLKWHKTSQALQVSEALRLGSMMMGCGVPPPALLPAHEAQRSHAVGLLKGAFQLFGEVSTEMLRWSVGESVYGPEVEPSLSGLIAAFESKRDRTLWDFPSEEPVGLLPVLQDLKPLTLLWADAVEDEERKEVEAARARGEVILKPIVSVKELRVRVEPPRQAATLARAGLMSPLVPRTKPAAKRPDLPVVDRGRGRVAGQDRLHMEESDTYSQPSEAYDDSSTDFDFDYAGERMWSEEERDDAV